MIEKAAESLLQVPFLIFMPFLAASSYLPEGWNLKELSEKNEKITYQLYVPSKKPDIQFSVVLFLKENAGKLTQLEVKKIQEQATLQDKIVIIPKNTEKKWNKEKAIIINKIINQISKYRNINLEKIEVFSQNQANELAINYVCHFENSVKNMVLLNYNEKIESCPNYSNSITINDNLNLKFWNNNNKNVNITSFKNISEVFGI